MISPDKRQAIGQLEKVAKASNIPRHSEARLPYERKELLFDSEFVGVWNRLIMREVSVELTLPIGVCYEDLRIGVGGRAVRLEPLQVSLLTAAMATRKLITIRHIDGLGIRRLHCLPQNRSGISSITKAWRDLRGLHGNPDDFIEERDRADGVHPGYRLNPLVVVLPDQVLVEAHRRISSARRSPETPVGPVE